MFDFIVAMPSDNTGHNHHSKNKQKSNKDDDDDMNGYDDSDDDDDDDDDKYATARDEIGRGEDDTERFARPDEVNQICRFMTQTREGTSAKPSKKSSGVVIGDSQMKSDSDMSVNFGNYFLNLINLI